MFVTAAAMFADGVARPRFRRQAFAQQPSDFDRVSLAHVGDEVEQAARRGLGGLVGSSRVQFRTAQLPDLRGVLGPKCDGDLGACALPAATGIWDEATRRYDKTKREAPRDRKSTRLNSSHLVSSYAVFCLT